MWAISSAFTSPRSLYGGMADANSFEPVILEPPPQILRPKRKRRQAIRVGGTWDIIGLHYFRRRRNACVRTVYCPHGAAGPRVEQYPVIRFVKPADWQDTESHYETGTLKPPEKSWNPKKTYVIVGVMGTSHLIPYETIVKVEKPETLFAEIRQAERNDRPFLRRLFTLKSVAGFGVYECNAINGYHTTVELTHTSTLVLSDFFLDYRSGEPDHGDRWRKWVHKELNMENPNPADGKYALQLLLRWDPVKIAIWFCSSVALSLGVGFWYQYHHQYKTDIARTGTAWAISSYILTAAGVLLALLAALTQIEDN